MMASSTSRVRWRDIQFVSRNAGETEGFEGAGKVGGIEGAGEGKVAEFSGVAPLEGGVMAY